MGFAWMSEDDFEDSDRLGEEWLGRPRPSRRLAHRRRYGRSPAEQGRGQHGAANERAAGRHPTDPSPSDRTRTDLATRARGRHAQPRQQAHLLASLGAATRHPLASIRSEQRRRRAKAGGAHALGRPRVRPAARPPMRAQSAADVQAELVVPARLPTVMDEHG